MKLDSKHFITTLAILILLITTGCNSDNQEPTPLSAPSPSPNNQLITQSDPTAPPENPTATPENPTPTPGPNIVVRPALGEGEFLIQGSQLDNFRVGDLLVVYFKEASGLELVAAVMQVVEENPDNRVALVVFRNANVDLNAIGTLAALRVDREMSQVNLERLVPVDKSFVGFILEDEPRIRIRSDAELQEGDALEVMKLSPGGNPQSFDPPVKMTIDKIEAGGNTAIVLAADPVNWLNFVGKLLVVSHVGGTYNIQVSDYLLSDICVRTGYNIEVRASGTVVVGEFVGAVSPEGKETFEMIVSVPIDPKYDIVKEFPHATLMYRLNRKDEQLPPDEKWLGYHNQKHFEADAEGCLAFDINDNDNSDNSGAFDIEVIVAP